MIITFIKYENRRPKPKPGYFSDVLSINAEIDDSDIEGHKVVKAEESAREALAPSSEPKVELQQDIDRSVSEILAPTSGLQQLELLELEMRARAIKVPMKETDVSKPVEETNI
uniref:Uncharacterized protein n=1 Tax=Cyprinus carpio TaxID=7962 RepID=A0A8C2BU99_CYPCA